MLIIRSEQTKVFELSASQRFEARMLPHVALYFPNHHAILGERRVTDVVRLGIARAKSYGICTQSDVCRYINLMWMFGSHFDRDQLLPWTGEILRGESLYTPAMRLDQVATQGLRYFAQITGDGHFLLNRAMLRLHQELPSMLARPVEGDLEEHLQRLLGEIYPSKHASMTVSARREFFASATAKAASKGMTSAAGIVIVAALMFMAGSGFDEDPQHAWASDVLDDPELLAEQVKLDRLCLQARAHLALWLARRN